MRQRGREKLAQQRDDATGRSTLGKPVWGSTAILEAAQTGLLIGLVAMDPVDWNLYLNAQGLMLFITSPAIATSCIAAWRMWKQKHT